MVRYMAPHEYYMLHIVPVRGGQSEVPSLIHNGVLMYMRMVTEPRGALVCASVGLRRPYAHTSDTRSYYDVQSEQFPINDYRYRLPPQRPGASTLSITWSLCSGGFGPATYR